MTRVASFPKSDFIAVITADIHAALTVGLGTVGRGLLVFLI